MFESAPTRCVKDNTCDLAFVNNGAEKSVFHCTPRSKPYDRVLPFSVVHGGSHSRSRLLRLPLTRILEREKFDVGKFTVEDCLALIDSPEVDDFEAVVALRHVS